MLSNHTGPPPGLGATSPVAQGWTNWPHGARTVIMVRASGFSARELQLLATAAASSTVT